MTDLAKYHGFTHIYKKPVKSLIAPINFLPVSSTDRAIRSAPVKLTALWDTGATLTFIKPYVQDRLKLYMARTSSPKTIAAVGGIFQADFVVAVLLFASDFAMGPFPVHVLDFVEKADAANKRGA